MNNTEQKLKKLFDFQRFEKNERLENLIRETESRYAAELSDDDLSLVNAAGEIKPGKVETDSGYGAAGIGSGTHVGGLAGDCKDKSNVSGNNTGGLTGSLSEEVGGLVGTPFGTKGGAGGGGVGGKDPAM